MAGVFHYGSRIAPFLERVAVDAASPTDVVEGLYDFRDTAGPLADTVATAAAADERVSPRAACGALYWMGRAGEKALVSLLDVPRVRWNALTALAELGRERGVTNATIADRIEPWIGGTEEPWPDGPEVPVALIAAAAYVVYAEPEQARRRVMPVLRRALLSPEWTHRSMAAWACEVLGPSARDLQGELLAATTVGGPGTRFAADAAWRALGRIGDPDRQVLAALVAEFAPPARPGAGPSLGAIYAVACLASQVPSLRPQIAPLANSKRNGVRIAAIEALVRLDGSIELWLAQLRSELVASQRSPTMHQLLEMVTRLGPVAAELRADLEGLRADPARDRRWDERLDRAIPAIGVPPAHASPAAGR